MELKEGIYVRTEKGIIFKYYPCKNTEYDKENNIYHEWDDWGEYDDYYIITKASENIIDLIKVGDYVNGLPVTFVYIPDGVKASYFLLGTYQKHFINEDIKDIVTKEQFEACKYVVERNK